MTTVPTQLDKTRQSFWSPSYLPEQPRNAKSPIFVRRLLKVIRQTCIAGVAYSSNRNRWNSAPKSCSHNSKTLHFNRGSPRTQMLLFSSVTDNPLGPEETVNNSRAMHAGHFQKMIIGSHRSGAFYFSDFAGDQNVTRAVFRP